jgi:hypothetical protein
MVKEVPEYQDPKAANVEPAESCGDESCGDESCGDESCGDGSLTRPGGPEVPGRGALDLTRDESTAALITRKPPTSVKAAAPKERKNGAHRASGG